MLSFQNTACPAKKSAPTYAPPALQPFDLPKAKFVPTVTEQALMDLPTYSVKQKMESMVFLRVLNIKALCENSFTNLNTNLLFLA